MPNPISLDTFRHLAQVGSNAEIRISSNDQVTTAPRRFGGRLIQQLFTGMERQGRQHIATEFLRGLEAEYGRDLARQAFHAVRKDLQTGARADEFVLGAKPLTARQVQAILHHADGMRNEHDLASLRELTGRYTARAAIVENLAERRHVPLQNMTPAHWQVFSQLLAEKLADERIVIGHIPDTQEADRLAGKLLAHVAGLTEDQLLAGVEARQYMRSQGQDLLMALAGRSRSQGQTAQSIAAQVDAFLNVTRNVSPLSRDFVADEKAELGTDGRAALDRMALNHTINSLTPAFARELLSNMKASGSEFRHFYSALNLLPAAAGAKEREGYVPACADVGSVMDLVLSNLARRAGEDGEAVADSFRPLADHARDANWARVVQGTGFPAAQMKADGLTSMDRVRDQIEMIDSMVTKHAQRLNANSAEESNETERTRRLARNELCEGLGNALWEISQAGNDACIVKGGGEVTPQIQAVLQQAGRELLDNSDVDLARVVSQLRRAGVVHGRGALGGFDLSYQALQDLTPIAQQEQTLVLNHLKEKATLFYPDPRVAEDLLKDYMIIAFNWADLHPEISDTNIREKAKTLHTELGRSRTGTDRNPDFRQVIEAFAHARIRMDREEFRPLTERLMAMFPQT